MLSTCPWKKLIKNLRRKKSELNRLNVNFYTLIGLLIWVSSVNWPAVTANSKPFVSSSRTPYWILRLIIYWKLAAEVYFRGIKLLHWFNFFYFSNYMWLFGLFNPRNFHSDYEKLKNPDTMTYLFSIIHKYFILSLSVCTEQAYSLISFCK